MEDISFGAQYSSRELRSRNRLSVSTTILHSENGEQPTALEMRFSAYPTEEGSPYKRNLTVPHGEVAIPLDTGWIKQASLIHIANKTGLKWQLIPSKEELADHAGAIVRLRHKDDAGGGILIRPGKFIIVELEDPSSYVLECVSSVVSAQVSLFVIPE